METLFGSRGNFFSRNAASVHWEKLEARLNGIHRIQVYKVDARMGSGAGSGLCGLTNQSRVDVSGGGFKETGG